MSKDTVTVFGKVCKFVPDHPLSDTCTFYTYRGQHYSLTVEHAWSRWIVSLDIHSVRPYGASFNSHPFSELLDAVNDIRSRLEDFQKDVGKICSELL